MEFDPSFQGQLQHPYLSSLFPRNPYLNPQIQTMFPPQSSILISPSPPPIMFHPTNTFHHIQDHIFDAPTHNPTFGLEGSLEHITNPFCGMLPSSLGSSLGSFTNASHHHPMMLPPPNNNNNNALHGHPKGKVIWDFSQKTMIHESHASSSKPPSPLSLPNMSEYNWESNQKKKVNINTNDLKGWWTPQEDSCLVELVNKFGSKKWSQIANFLPGRIGKQCRERWYNHLRPNIKKESWTLEEDMIVIKAHKEIGNKWSEIARRVPGRTENSIKNHWNGIKRRQCLKRNKNKKKNTSYDDSVLQAYIKEVIATEKVAKVQKNFVTKNNEKVLGRSCDDLRSYNLLNGNSSNCVTMM